MGAPTGPQNSSRKRSYHDRNDGDAQDRSHVLGDSNGRPFKQPRRGGPGPGMGRGNFDGGRGGFSGGRGAPTNQVMPPQGFPPMPGMPSPPPGMPPLDPNNPLAALLAMQAMGFPIPGLPDFPQAPPMSQQKPRCKDYDVKGFCAKGNTCQFEHGKHSIWVPPANRGDEYDPTDSSLMAGIESSSPGAAPNFNLFRGGDRGRGRGGFRGDGRPQNNGMSRRSGRSEFSSDRPNVDRNNAKIVVEQIPEEKFSEEKVREFFSQFGNIEEVEMRPYKRLAIVKFSDWDSAKAAYSSPKVIFDNRFVKVYWYVDQDSLPKPPVNAAANGGIKRATPGPNNPVPARETSEPQIDIEEFTRKQQEAQKVHEEKLKKKLEMEATKKELEKRQEELLKNQAEEKRKLMEKLAAKGVKTESPAAGTANGNTTSVTAKPVSQTEALKAQLAALEAEAQSLGIDTSLSEGNSWGGRGRGRGRGGFRGRGEYVPRGAPRGGYRGRGAAPFAASGRTFNLDNRPKTISLTGVDFSDTTKEDLLREHVFVSHT